MKFLRTTLLTVLFTVFLVVFQQNYVMTRTSFAPQGNTGSPGDNNSTCRGCHSGNAPTETLIFANISLNGNAVTSYISGETYDIEVVLNNSTVKSGFSMTVEDDNTGHHGTFVAGSKSRVDGDYIGHSNADATSSWTFQWIAPNSDVGNLTFYMAGNIANGSGTGGDIIHTNNVTLTPEVIVNPTCDVPTNLMIDLSDGATLSWANNGADAYQLGGRKQGGNPKVFAEQTTTFRSFSQLQANTTYEWSVRSICNGVATDWAPIQSFSTN